MIAYKLAAGQFFQVNHRKAGWWWDRSTTDEKRQNSRREGRREIREEREKESREKRGESRDFLLSQWSNRWRRATGLETRSKEAGKMKRKMDGLSYGKSSLKTQRSFVGLGLCRLNLFYDCWIQHRYNYNFHHYSDHFPLSFSSVLLLCVLFLLCSSSLLLFSFSLQRKYTQKQNKKSRKKIQWKTKERTKGGKERKGRKKKKNGCHNNQLPTLAIRGTSDQTLAMNLPPQTREITTLESQTGTHHRKVVAVVNPATSRNNSPTRTPPLLLLPRLHLRHLPLLQHQNLLSLIKPDSFSPTSR